MIKKLSLTLLMLFITSSVFAITDEERSALLRATAEIMIIETIVEEAEQGVNVEDRKKIQYETIKQDLEKIRQGLLDVINEVRREPRMLPPISGEYL
ncbi:MAG: hypothetical protein COA78_24295 [Blastopirellula sp.]|nr:MAG: hypothetical protein COA78_24295 [Blastopirellula sp.]